MLSGQALERQQTTQVIFSQVWRALNGAFASSTQKECYITLDISIGVYSATVSSGP